MNVDSSFESPVVLSLCPGILGLERGVERAIGKIRVAAYVEIEAFIIENLVAAMEAGVLAPAPIWSDVKTFNAEPFRSRIHGIIGGYPCQPFSHAGLRKGENDPRHLWPFIREIIRTTKPHWCFFENVRGHLTLGFDVVHRELSEMGYRVEAGIFSAEEVGATHKRERLFILAVDNTTSERLQTSGFTDFWQLSKEDRQELLDRSEQPGDQLANTESTERETAGNTRTGWAGFTDGGTELAHTENSDRRLLLQPGRSRQNSFEPERSGEDVANNNTGRGKLSRSFSVQSQFLPVKRSSTDKWPAGQGSYQHDWEEPRAVEPGVGCTINGYNFRTDLLRAYGNAVVEQTAELAFNTLLQKHFNNANKN